MTDSLSVSNFSDFLCSRLSTTSSFISNGFFSQFLQLKLSFQANTNFSSGYHLVEILAVYTDLLLLGPYCNILIKWALNLVTKTVGSAKLLFFLIKHMIRILRALLIFPALGSESALATLSISTNDRLPLLETTFGSHRIRTVAFFFNFLFTTFRSHRLNTLTPGVQAFFLRWS